MGNKEIEQCNLCGHESELCGTYLTTRGNIYTEKIKVQEKPKRKGPILKNLRTKAIGDRCISIQPLVGPNLLDEKEHEYRLVNPVMSETGYAKRMFMNLSWVSDFRLFSTFILSSFKKETRGSRCKHAFWDQVPSYNLQ